MKKNIEEKDNIIRKPIKSSGPGGQHVNKTQSAILLQDKKTNISVKVGNSRDSVVNSGIAKKRLIDKLDLHYNGAESKIAKKIEKIKKQKDRNRRKRENKHNLDDYNKNDFELHICLKLFHWHSQEKLNFLHSIRSLSETL